MWLSQASGLSKASECAIYMIMHISFKNLYLRKFYFYVGHPEAVYLLLAAGLSASEKDAFGQVGA